MEGDYMVCWHEVYTKDRLMEIANEKNKNGGYLKGKN